MKMYYGLLYSLDMEFIPDLRNSYYRNLKIQAYWSYRDMNKEFEWWTLPEAGISRFYCKKIWLINCSKNSTWILSRAARYIILIRLSEKKLSNILFLKTFQYNCIEKEIRRLGKEIQKSNKLSVRSAFFQALSDSRNME